MNKRQEELVRCLSELQFAKLEQLAERFAVSEETIRRDLLELEKSAPVKRVRGGAVYSASRAQEMEYARRMEVNQLEKRAIARLASEYINDGEALVLNNGTATLELARCLVDTKHNLTLVTNSLDIALLMNKNETNSVYLTAGYMRRHNKSLVGSLCADCLDNFKVDKTLLSVDGVSVEDGVTEYNTEEAAVIRKMMEIGRKHIILCESSKFREVVFHKVCDATGVDTIFTDWNIPAREVEAWAKIGVKVLAAPMPSSDK